MEVIAIRPDAGKSDEHRGRALRLSTRNVTVAGRRTSMRLEPEMWEALAEISRREGRSLNDLCTEVNRRRTATGLTAAMRTYALNYFRAAATEEGHRLVGHGRLGAESGGAVSGALREQA